MRRISGKLSALIASRRQLRSGLKRVASDIKSPRQLAAEGYDPAHAAYIAAQNYASFFAERVSMLDELNAYCELAGAAEEEYMPGGPPMSPLSTSYFTSWAFFDLRFGPDRETIGSCLLDVGEQIGLSPDMALVLRLYERSRMGIYEHAGMREGRAHLKELITGSEFACHVPTGYAGKKGELWYVRLLPSPGGLFPADYHVAMTTPYILGGATKEDWIAYLRKSSAEAGFADIRDGVYAFLKFGREPNFWNEFIFLSYVDYQTDAVFLAGLPDVRASLPHGDLAGGGT